MLYFPMTDYKTLPIPSLVELLKKHSDAYYNGTAEISDAEYDSIRDALEVKDPAHPYLSEVGATTVGTKVKHLSPMLSLRKITNSGELSEWWAKVAQTNSFGTPAPGASTPAVVVVVQPKLDGSTLELQYKNGILDCAVTRGDGVEGEDVTVSARLAGGVPATVAGFTGAVRGEVILSRANWALVDPEMKTNARNVGNGILCRQSDLSQAHMLNFIAYGVHGINVPTETEVEQWLYAAGFSPAMSLIALNRVDAMDAVNNIQSARHTLPYDIDGAVLRANALGVHEELGVSSGRPHAQIAYKWPSATATTTVMDIELTVGHTGLISPTAALKPVQLGGVTVSNALLNNWVEIGNLGVNVGDTVEIIRTGEIIPKIIRVVKKNSVGNFPEPTNCPCCGGPAGRAVNPTGSVGAVTVCQSDECPAKTTGRIKRWIKSLDILGIGDELLGTLTYETGLVKTPADLYSLTADALAQQPMGKGKVGTSRAAAVVANIQAKRMLTIPQLFGSLGIPHLGKRRVEILMDQAAGKLSELDQWQSHNLRDVLPALLPAMAPIIIKWFEDNAEFVLNMMQVLTVVEHSRTFTFVTTSKAPGDVVLGQDPDEQVAKAITEKNLVAAVKQAHPKHFVLTGKFEVQKSVLHAEISAAGHTYGDDIDKNTTHLVQAYPSSESNKSKKAKAKGIAVIGVEELRALLAQ